MPSQLILEQKSSEVDSIKELFKEYPVIGLADLKKVRATQLQEFKN